jgi:hypothetical protein
MRSSAGRYADQLRTPVSEPEWVAPVSKKTKKRRLRARRKKANHGKRPNVGRR